VIDMGLFSIPGALWWSRKSELLSGLLGRHPRAHVSELRWARRRPLQSAKTLLTPSGKFPSIFRRRRVSPVAMVPPVVAVSPGVDMLAGLWVVSVSAVLAMRRFSFVHEGFGPAIEPNGRPDSEHLGSGMSRRNRAEPAFSAAHRVASDYRHHILRARDTRLGLLRP
jgi:hypothetical protein